ncbi:hypothetical protein CKALI_07415 [Corynebacterium kalinowskii]|uniref:DUF2567 domain-containing protein n=1 Tax=Corynebacterium kalinowskii TaxID=2675216 RepID=A0A6B8VTS7_9CORY|nr:hypothetical protein [Corynebacterium kalinowskii]QGU02345.1 hypothetical protein CKALI_07415 [Corynebacterium kalinowskii]
MKVTQQAPDSTSTVRRSGRTVPTVVGGYAELLVVSLAAFGLAGLGWGLWRPTMSGTIAEGGGVEITDPSVMNGNREFTTFGVMVFCFLVLGIALALWTARRGRQFMSPLLLVWGVVCSALGSALFFLSGTKLALWRVGVPNPDELHVGSELTYLPDVGLSVAGLVAPFVFLISAWCLAIFGPDEAPAQNGVGAPEV